MFSQAKARLRSYDFISAILMTPLISSRTTCEYITQRSVLSNLIQIVTCYAGLLLSLYRTWESGNKHALRGKPQIN